VVYVEFDTLSWSAQWMLVRAVPGMVRWTLAHDAELTYRNGRTLKDDLSPETMQKLRSFYGDDLERYQNFTPAGLLFWSEFLNSQGEEGTGVDDVFTALAHKHFKPIHSLDDHSTVQLVMPTLDAIFEATKRDIAERGADAVISEKLTESGDDEGEWRHGDLAATERVHAEVTRISPELYQRLLPERNRKWMPQIQHALREERNVMVLVGAAHLGGKEGLLQMLRDAGYNPERMYGIDRP
jgi:uncharacterized protein YbaP (TraB family)